MYINLLTKIRNAQSAKKKKVIIAPFSKIDAAIANLLANYNFIKSAEIKGKTPKCLLEIVLHNKTAIDGIKLISRPSRKIYVGCRDLKPVKNGRGIAVLSTPKGIVSGKEAKKQNLGGEILFEIW